MKCALYHRVSTEEQDKSNARDVLLKAAEQRGYEVLVSIEETGSGAKNDRPGLIQVMELARQRKIKAVLVWAVDRFGRSQLDFLGNLEELHKYGVTFIAVHQNLEFSPDKDDPMARLIMHMTSAFAEFERGMIRARTKQGMIKAKRYGTKSGKTIGGQYKHVKITAWDRPKVLKLREEGNSYKRIAQTLGCSIFEVRKVLHGSK
jgi:putative DNA-invertase from lambdoid prophage Rac